MSFVFSPHTGFFFQIGGDAVHPDHERNILTAGHMAFEGGISWGTRKGVDAYVYYASLGLIDPKLPFEAWAYGGAMGKSGAARFLIGGAAAASIGMLGVGTLGFLIDPKHLRPGKGLDETGPYQDFMEGFHSVKPPWERASYL